MLSGLGVCVDVNYIYHITTRKGKQGKRLKRMMAHKMCTHVEVVTK